MNTQQQLQPGDGSAKGALASATMQDLWKELKRRCDSFAFVGSVINDDGSEGYFIKTTGCRMFVIGACESVKHHYLGMQLADAED